MENPYLALTTAFNRGRLRAVLSSGQAVVVHRLAVMSKDGDWILREDEEACEHVLSVLAERRGRYRFGAPLDRRWLAGGWSTHFEHRIDGLRVRTDFVSRPPRISAQRLAAIWHDAEHDEIPVVPVEPLAELKKTNREKDYVVIGELARRMDAPEACLLYSRSARDLLALAEAHLDLIPGLLERRPVLSMLGRGREELERALDAERRELMRANEERLAHYLEASQPWAAIWPEVKAEIEGKPLAQAHAIVVERATAILPFSLGEES